MHVTHNSNINMPVRVTKRVPFLSSVANQVPLTAHDEPLRRGLNNGGKKDVFSSDVGANL